MTARQRAGLAAAAFVAAAMLACGDPNAPVANYRNYADTLELYALNGAPRGAPTAIRIFAPFGGAAAAVDASFLFDIAVDINDEGRPVLYPVRAVAAPFLDKHSVGIQRTTRPFDEILEAPTGGYVRDSAAVLNVGEVVLLQSADPEACGIFFGGVIYAKMIVDSVSVPRRRIFARVTGDPNCGFRSLAVPGPPTD